MININMHLANLSNQGVVSIKLDALTSTNSFIAQGGFVVIIFRKINSLSIYTISYFSTQERLSIFLY